MSDVQDAGNATLAQTGRLLQINTSLGKDKVLLTNLIGEDAISRPFMFEVEFATHETETQVRGLLGKPVTIVIGGDLEAGGRPVHGIVRRLSGYTGDIRGFQFWRAEVVPRLWLLSCVADCRIFQDKSVLDILDVVLKEQSVTDYEMRVSPDDYPKLEYCVQYRETTLALVSRLMERFGLFYWHEHEAGRHLLVIADSNTRAKAVLGGAAVLSGQSRIGNIEALQDDYLFRPGKWTLEDFDFEAPAKNLIASTPTVVDVPQMAEHEIYDYPGGYTDRQLGTWFTRRHIEGEEAEYHRLRGVGSSADFDAGRRCKAKSVLQDAPEEEFLLTEVRHRASDRTQITASPPPPQYTNDFVAIPIKLPYRHQRVTPRPFVQGPQTAIVTGPSGEQIYTDKYGRVKVRFHWDRNPDGNKDETSSCWIRVSQGWAGRNWGAIHLPRVGQEVIVDFLEGDPDRPIITGRVYNGDNPVPYGLPDNRTQSGIKSRSVPGSGSNEIRFEDKSGSEEVWVHAQKDMNTKIENNETRKILANRTTEITGNETKTVDGNVSETVKGTETRTVVGNVSETFNANETRTIGSNISQTIGGSVTETIAGSRTETIAGSLKQTVTGGITVTTPGAINVTAVGGFSVIAPGGTRYVDDFFDKTGGKNFQAYAITLSISASKTDIVAGLSLGYTMNKIDISSMKIDVAGAAFKNEPTKITSVGQAITTAYCNLHTAGLFAFL